MLQPTRARFCIGSVGDIASAVALWRQESREKAKTLPLLHLALVFCRLRAAQWRNSAACTALHVAMYFALRLLALLACISWAWLLHTNDEAKKVARLQQRFLALYDLNKSPPTRHSEKMNIRHYLSCLLLVGKLQLPAHCLLPIQVCIWWVGVAHNDIPCWSSITNTGLRNRIVFFHIILSDTWVAWILVHTISSQ